MMHSEHFSNIFTDYYLNSFIVSNCDKMAQQALNQKLVVLDNVEKAYMRAFALHHGFIYFSVFHEEESATSQVGQSRTVLNVMVHEESQWFGVEVRSMGQVVSGSNGFQDYREPMIPRCKLTGEEIGTITDTVITEPQVGQNNAPLMRWCCQPTSHKAEVYTQLQQQGQAGCINDVSLCKINKIRKSATITLDFTKSITSSRRKLLIILASLKMYFCVYNYHQNVLPVGIPALMRAFLPPEQSLDNLANTHKLTMRVSCQDANGNLFIDFLHEPSYEIELVAQYTDRNRFRVLINDIFGQLQFSSFASGARGDNNQGVYDHGAVCFGYTTTGNLADYFDPQSNERAMYELQSNDRTMRQVHRQCDAETVAWFKYFEKQNILCIEILESLNVMYKALILSRAAGLALCKHKMDTDIKIPTLAEYPFRSS